MIPGQKVNKDVYAVNIGSVPAFVNEDVTAKLNYTYEIKSKTLTDKSVVLNDIVNGAVTYEAGGMLAWTDAKNTVPKYEVSGVEYTKETIGVIAATSDGANDSKEFTIKYSKDGGTTYYATAAEPNKLYTIAGLDTDDTNDDIYTDASLTVTVGTKKDGAVDVGAVNSVIVEGNGWTPTEEGAYIFRRKINGDINPGSETFTYSGYYFAPKGTRVGSNDLEKDTYYKIIIGNDTYSKNNGTDSDGVAKIEFDIFANQADVQTLGATINKDGTIKGTVDYNFVDVESTGTQELALMMDSTNNRLIASYSKAAVGATDTNGNAYDASAVAARAEVDYQNAKKFSDLADKLYAYAEADIAYAKKLAEERNKLIQAAIDTKNVHDAQDAAETTKNQAWDDVFATGEALDDFVNAYNAFATTATDNLTTLKPENFVPSNVQSATQSDNPQVYANYQALKDLYDNKIVPCKDAIDAAVVVLKGYQTNNVTNKNTDPADIQDQIDIIRENLRLLDTADPKGYLQQYKDKYADVVNSAIADQNIILQNVNPDDQKTRIQSVIGLCDTAKTDANTLDTVQDAYKDAYDAWTTANENEQNQDGKWAQALEDYNDNVTTAKTTYENATTDAANGNSRVYNGQNHEATIVGKYGSGYPTYSLTNRTTNNNVDPTIDTNLSGADAYATYVNVPSATTNEDTIKANLEMSYHYTTTTQQVNDPGADQYIVGTNANVEDRFANVAALKTDKNTDRDAKYQAYVNAVSTLQGSSDIVFYINLAPDWATNWEYDDFAADTLTNAAANPKMASFYYKKILEPGVTTEKLIDSVELANTVKATDYKDLTFDLNVALDSAQVTYEDDQKTYKADAVQSPAFGMDVESITDNVNVAWADKAAAAQRTKCSIDNGTVEVTPVSINLADPNGGDNYTWFIKIGNDYYVARSRADGTVFYNAVVTTDTDGNVTEITYVDTAAANAKTLKVERVDA